MLKRSLTTIVTCSLFLFLSAGFVGCGGPSPAGPGDETDVPDGGDPAMEGGVEEGGDEGGKPPGVE